MACRQGRPERGWHVGRGGLDAVWHVNEGGGDLVVNGNERVPGGMSSGTEVREEACRAGCVVVDTGPGRLVKRCGQGEAAWVVSGQRAAEQWLVDGVGDWRVRRVAVVASRATRGLGGSACRVRRGAYSRARSGRTVAVETRCVGRGALVRRSGWSGAVASGGIVGGAKRGVSLGVVGWSDGQGVVSLVWDKRRARGWVVAGLGARCRGDGGFAGARRVIGCAAALVGRRSRGCLGLSGA